VCSNALLCTFNYDTLISSGLALLVTLAIGFIVVATLRRGTPHKVQMVFEVLIGYVRNLTSETVAEDAAFIMPLAATIFFFILSANWLDMFPLVAPVEPANADINLTLAMALVVIIIVEWYSVRVLGWKRFFYRYTHPFDAPILMRIVFVPINVITEIAKPLSLALRLFGNIFGGVVVVYLLTLRLQVFRHPRRTCLSGVGAACDRPGRLEGVRRVRDRHHPGLHLHAPHHHLFRHGSGRAS